MGGGVKEGRKGGGKWRKGARRRWAHAMYSFFILYVTNLVSYCDAVPLCVGGVLVRGVLVRWGGRGDGRQKNGLGWQPLSSPQKV